jgi:hypothetical protein
MKPASLHLLLSRFCIYFSECEHPAQQLRGMRKRPDMRVALWTFFIIPVRSHQTWQSTSLALSAYFVSEPETLLNHQVSWRKRPDMSVFP